jgi:hypothetical protein
LEIPLVTANEVQNWIGDQMALPPDIDRLILRASELIWRHTYHQTEIITAQDTQLLTNVKNATCAQIEYWLQIDEASDITGPLGAMKLKDFAFDSKFAVLAPRTRDILLDAGLLYKGIGTMPNTYRGMDVK